jgi:transposase-like protein
VRCPACGGLETKRHGRSGPGPVGWDGRRSAGLQRFWCHRCAKTFTFGRPSTRSGRRFNDEVALEAARLYVQGLVSYRTLSTLVSDRVGRRVSRVTLNSWVDDLGSRALTALELSGLLSPTWSGWLGVDGKAIYVRGDERCLLLAVDQGTQDIVHALVAPAETEAAFEQIVREAVTVAAYPLQGLVIDAAAPFVAGWANYFSGVPVQLCRIHAARRLEHAVPKAKRSATAARRAELKARIRAIVFAPTYAEACQGWYSLVSDTDRYRGLGRVDPIAGLGSLFNLYFAHHRVPGLPADANITENVIKQLSKKLRLMEGFATDSSAERFVRLLTACYRFKPFTDSCRAANNGRHPSNWPASTPPASTGSASSPAPPSNTQLDAPRNCVSW